MKREQPAIRTDFSPSLRADLSASVVVFLVALPLSMGIALASGVSVSSGLISAVIGGIVVGALSGSPLQVSGPAAGLMVLVYDIVVTQKLGIGGLGVVVAIAGALQLISGLLRLGQWFRAVSPAVIQGMLAGIGVLIFASQFHVMVDDAPRGSGLKDISSLPESLWKGLVPLDGSLHHWAARAGLTTIVLLLGWKWLAPRSLRNIPAPLVAIVVTTAAVELFGLGINRVSVPASLLDAIKPPPRSAWALLADWRILLEGAAMAFIASAETLLCATAVDKMHGGPRTRYDRELAAQGVGNMLCGLVGGLPLTGVIVRSSANVDAGARSRKSAIFHGVWMLAAVLLLPGLLRLIPTAGLAAILVYTGAKLVNVKAIRALAAFGRMEVVVCIATIVGVVTNGLLEGVLFGMLLSVLRLLYLVSRLSVRMEDRPHRNQTFLYLRGSATFLRLPKLAAALDQVPPSRELHVHLEQLDFIDHACFDLLISWGKQHESTGGKLVIDWDFLTARFKREHAGDSAEAA